MRYTNQKRRARSLRRAAGLISGVMDSAPMPKFPIYVCQQKHILSVRDLIANTGSSFARDSSGEGILRRDLFPTRSSLGNHVLILRGPGWHHIANAGADLKRLHRAIILRGFENQVLMTRPDVGSVRVQDIDPQDGQ